MAGSAAATGGPPPGGGPSPHGNPQFVAAAAAGGPDPGGGGNPPPGTQDNPIIIPDDPQNPDQYNGRGENGSIDSTYNRLERIRIAKYLEPHVSRERR